MNNRATSNDARDLGAFIPSFLDDYGLDPHEFRIYAHIARRAGGGVCFEGLKGIARCCQMDVKTVRAKLAVLVEVGMIHCKESAGRPYEFTLTKHSDWAHPETIPEIRQKHTPTKNGRGAKSGSTRSGSGTKNGITSPTKSGSTPLPDLVPKGDPIKEILNEGTPFSLGDAGATPDAIAKEGDQGERPSTLPTPASKEPVSLDNKNGSEKTSISPRKSRKKEKWSSKAPPARSKFHPEKSLELWEIWSEMFLEYRGDRDDRQGFMKGLDFLLEEGVEMAEIEQGLRYYAGERMKAAKQGQKHRLSVPPDGIRFFQGKDGGVPYCVRAYELWAERYGGKREDGSTAILDRGSHFELARKRGIVIALEGGETVHLRDGRVLSWEEFATEFPVEKLQEELACTK